MPGKIPSLTGHFRFLSNFWPCQVFYDGLIYPSAEHAYQAAKTVDPAQRALVLCCVTAGIAKRTGQKIILREGWEEIKVSVMEGIVLEKFYRNTDLREQLIATGMCLIEEGNTWGDEFWGVNIANGRGRNELGRILMKVRSALN